MTKASNSTVAAVALAPTWAWAQQSARFREEKHEIERAAQALWR